VLTILRGFCPVCGRRFKNNFDAYNHLTRFTNCSARLYETFSASVVCDFVNEDLAYMMFPFNVIDVYRSYARDVICLGRPPDSFDGSRVYVNLFDIDGCYLKSYDVVRFIGCRGSRRLRSRLGSLRGVEEDGDG
jgi:hypothetical protein